MAANRVDHFRGSLLWITFEDHIGGLHWRITLEDRFRGSLSITNCVYSFMMCRIASVSAICNVTDAGIAAASIGSPLLRACHAAYGRILERVLNLGITVTTSKSLENLSIRVSRASRGAWSLQSHGHPLKPSQYYRKLRVTWYSSFDVIYSIVSTRYHSLDTIHSIPFTWYSSLDRIDYHPPKTLIDGPLHN